MPAERHPLPHPALHPALHPAAHPASHRGLQRRLLILAAAALPGLALAQKWPAQPVRIVVPYTAGGGSDNIARALGTELSRELGQPVVVDNKPGASAMLGAELVARAAPDGYTLLLADMPHTITPSLYKTPYDALKDFTPVALIGSSPLVLAVNPKLKAQSVKEYIAMARARPGQINFASGGTGTATHLAGELFKQQTDTFITHIPYKGSGQAVADVVAGHTESMFSSAPTVIPHIKSGALRALATTGAQRSPALPQVPTMAESGVRGLTVLHWFGLLAPARLPPGIQTALHDAVARAMATPALQAKLQSLGLELTPRTAAEFGAQMETDAARWARVIKERNIKADWMPSLHHHHDAVDLRSDTVTRPTPQMLEAMACAPLGDDGLDGDPTVRALEETAAQRFGKAAGLFVASGTMGNLVAVLTHGRMPGEVLAEAGSHLLNAERAAAGLTGMHYRSLPGDGGLIALPALEAALDTSASARCPSALVAVENTHNARGGSVAAPESLAALHALAARHGVPVHTDGARLFNAAVALGLSCREIAAHTDSVTVCLSKGLSAPVGSVLMGPADFIARARGIRRMLGGTMRQAGVIAAAGLVALEHMADRLAEDHARARRLHQGLRAIHPAWCAAELPQTNIVQVRVGTSAADARLWEARLAEAGVLVRTGSAGLLRLVTHRHIDDKAVDSTLQAFTRLHHDN